MSIHHQALSLSASQIDTPWFEQRRDHFVRQAVDDFFDLLKKYHHLYGQYRRVFKGECTARALLTNPQARKLCEILFAGLSDMLGSENSRGTLWRLKDLCHSIWPKQARGESMHGSLIDWLVGSIFHEAMKLKENLYLLQNYGQAVFNLEQDDTRSFRPAQGLEVFSQVVDAKGLFQRIADDVLVQIEQIGLLLGQTSYLLRRLMPELARNALVVRLLVEHEETVLALWGESLTNVFNDMFMGNAASGFCAAGRNYLAGQWYKQSLEVYERALSLDPSHEEAITKTIQLQAILKDDCCIPK
ncbi:hypothetical protein [Desulfogranum japonicum]|uniref:hypothetical protein n=1 Tax=Desulfogranum japonicum TaxID=231447 RepID=UPI000419C9CC|nr:hypothetical protein [Desulfogranum japonicum]